MEPSRSVPTRAAPPLPARAVRSLRRVLFSLSALLGTAASAAALGAGCGSGSSEPAPPSDADAAPEGTTSGDASSADGAASGDASIADAAAGDASSADAAHLPDGGISCSGPDPLVAYPAGPHGIYVLEFEYQFAYPDAGTAKELSATAPPSYLLDAPTICGANVFVDWSTVDQGPDAGAEFDFSTIDQMIAPWVAAGKKVNLIVVSFASGQVSLPAYVAAQVPQVACGGGKTIPQFWTSTYESLFERFISAVLTKYGSDPSIGYMRFGLTGGGEAAVATGCPDVADAGLTEDLLESYDTAIVDYLHAHQGSVPLVTPTLGFGGGPRDDGGLGPVWQLEVDTAKANGLGIGTESLATSFFDDAGVCDERGGTCDVFAQGRGIVPLYAQPSVYCTPPADSCDLSQVPDGTDNQGSMALWMPYGVSAGIQIFELYLEDVRIAYDPSFPAYAQYGGQMRGVLESTAAQLGGAP